jgi:integrase
VIDESAMRVVLPSDNLPLSESSIDTASSAFAVVCNQVATAQAGRIAVVCNEPDAAAAGCDDPEVLRFLEAATAANTRRAYRTDVAHFIAWGGSIPSDSATIARYLAHHASVLTSATLTRRVVGIGRAHVADGLPDPTKAELVRRTLRGIRRVHAKPQRRVAPLVVEELSAICNSLGNSVKETRDRALLLIGFAGAFRRSELIAVDCEDVERTASGMIVTIRRSKTDQEAHGRRIHIPSGYEPVCPVVALERWLTLSKITEGPIFRPVTSRGTVLPDRLSREAVASIIKQRVKSLGRDASRYSGHSLRAGFVTSAALSGVPAWRIKAQTGHLSDGVLARYIREAESTGAGGQRS